MNFIFPQNYKFKTKIFGLIDYQTAIFTAIWLGLVFIAVNVFFKSINIKVFLFIIFSFPMLLFSIIGVNGENMVNVLIYIIKFLAKPKLLFYSK